MARILLVACACIAFLEGTAVAQCGGGGSGGQISAGGSGSLAMSSGYRSAGTGATLLTGPGSLAYDMMMAQLVQQRVAQQQAMLAMQKQQAQAAKLASRKYHAEQTRSQVAESRARTRAMLAAQNGLPAKSPPAALIAYSGVKR